jgi:Cu/Ag efflux protein CusF
VKKTVFVISSLALVGSLAACKKQAEPSAPEPSATMMSGSMANMPMAGMMKHGMAAGTVTAIDAAKGTVTLDHGPMSGLDWPVMTMGFAVEPDLLAGIKVGDKVDFEIDWDGKEGAVTSTPAEGVAGVAPAAPAQGKASTSGRLA